LHYLSNGKPYFKKPVDFKGPLYNGQSAAVNTAPLAVLSFCISSQVPYSPAAAQLHHGLFPYFVRSSSELVPEDHDDNSDDDLEPSRPKVEPDCLASGPDSDGEDPSSDCEAREVITVPDAHYTYQALDFNLGNERLRRSYRKRLAKVRDLMAKYVIIFCFGRSAHDSQLQEFLQTSRGGHHHPH
jgi:hypothetical protein